MFSYHFVTESFSKENEAVMKALISENEDELIDALKKYRDEIDAHKICGNGTTIACAAVKTRNINNLKVALGDINTSINTYDKQSSPKRLRTSCISMEFPRKDPANKACLYRSNFDAGVSQDYRYSYGFGGKGKISQLDNFGKNCLHYAVLEDQLEMVEYLLKNFQELHCNQVDRSSKSPLHLAVDRENEEMVKLLLKLGANIDFRDNEGKTALHNATEKGCIKMMKILLEANSDINALDYTGQSTLILAAVYDQCEALEFLLKRGAGVNYEDDRGFTALKRAIYLKNAKATKILVQHGARICESQYLLHHATVYNQIEIADSLIDGGARLEARDIKGKTPLMCAIEHKRFEMAKFLLEKGANPNTTNAHSGTTSLHTSMFYIYEPGLIEAFIDMLIEYGANVYSRCNFGYDALYYAFMHKNDAGACHLIKIMDVNFKHKVVRLDYLSSCMTHSKGPEPIKWLMHAGFNLNNFVNKSVDPIEPDKMNEKQRFLHDFLCQTLSLKDLCRIQIRRLVKPENILKLPLPSTLHSFLFLKE